MNYNIHPLFVHFPVALLFVYSIIKILPLKRWFPRVAWRDIERVLLLVGVLGAFGALATGDTAEHLVHPNRQLVEMHATFGAITTWIYGLLLVGEIAAVFNTYRSRFSAAWNWLFGITQWIETILCNPVFSGILALLGFVAITVTGMLGGVIAYGLTADPIAPVLLKILGIQL